MKQKTIKQLQKENEQLRIRLEEAEEALQAIRDGAVDAVVISGPKGEQVFTLTGEEAGLSTSGRDDERGRADGDARGAHFVLQRAIQQDAAPADGTNPRRNLEEFVKQSSRKAMAAIIIGAQMQPTAKRVEFLTPGGTVVPGMSRQIFSVRPIP